MLINSYRDYWFVKKQSSSCLWLCFFVLFLAGCQAGDEEVTDAGSLEVNNGESERLTEWLNDEYAQQLDFSPMTQTRLGDKIRNGELDDVSEPALFKQLDWYEDSVNRLREDFDY